MIAISLQSGSNGNCIYVESGGVRLLFDAGISGIQAEQRLFSHRREIRKVDAVLISHDHSDHVRCAGVYQRKFKLPIMASGKTADAAGGLRDVKEVGRFESGGKLHFGTVTVETHRTPHDAADGVVFVVDDGARRLGILTDLGHPFDAIAAIIASCDALFIESNYDPDMLENGPYPEFLKARIRGPHGHISNFECAELLRDHTNGRLKWACLAHLSEHNNKPELALQTHRAVSTRGNYDLHAASRFQVSKVFEV